MKKRILACSESSLRGTGFGVYYHEILSRLHATGKYEICELAGYAKPEEPHNVPWKFIPNNPAAGNAEQERRYRNDYELNQYGQWKFEQTCLDFHPDIVFDVRDPWMFRFQFQSPLRKYFHWAIMPTVDGTPQSRDWIQQFVNADAVFTYSDWAIDVLKKEANGKIKIIGAAPPAADYEIFRPVSDKRAHKKYFGIDESCIIVGSVMRNQSRKLYPDLITAFAKYLQKAPIELARKSYLYLHVAWPDIDWNIPQLIKESGIANRIMFTYVCKGCRSSFPSFFQGGLTFCRSCGEKRATVGSSEHGVERDNLAGIFNLFDLYVQYSTHEGFGMPQVEAAACGVPVMSIDYSAMEDVVRKIGGSPIPYFDLKRDPYTHRMYAVSDNDMLADMLLEKMSLPSGYRIKEGMRTRRLAMNNYSYDRSAKMWEDHFDSLELPDHSKTWCSPANYHEPAEEIPSDLTNEEFIRWALVNVAGRPDLIGTYYALKLVNDLNMGFVEVARNARATFKQSNAAQRLLEICENRNAWEHKRTGVKA